MKFLIYSFLFLLFVPSSFSQGDGSFKVIGESVNNEVVAKGKRLDISKIKVQNTSDEAIYLEWETVSNTFPTEWDCSMCQHGACQIGIPEGSIFKKLNADQLGFIAIHVMPGDTSGEGTVIFKIYDKHTPENFELLTFNVTVN
jgi:hypothetical protein